MEKNEEEMWTVTVPLERMLRRKQFTAESFIRRRRLLSEKRSRPSPPADATQKRPSPPVDVPPKRPSPASNASAQQPETATREHRNEFIENFKRVAQNADEELRKELVTFFRCVVEGMVQSDVQQDELRLLHETEADKCGKLSAELSKKNMELIKKELEIARVKQELATFRCMHELTSGRKSEAENMRAMVDNLKAWLATQG